MIETLSILILIALSLQLLPFTLGLTIRKSGIQTLYYLVVLIAGQVIFYYLGHLLGQRFLHLLDAHSNIVILSGFFIIGIRMILDSFKIRKGDRTFAIDSFITSILIAVVAGINTFLAGLLTSYFSTSIFYDLLVLTIASIIVSVVGMQIKLNRQHLALSALFIFVAGLTMFFSAIYIGFFTF